MPIYTTENPQANFCPYCMSKVQPGEVCKSCSLKQGSYTPSPHHIPPGTVLMGRYLIGRVLGEGGFGITYIGCDLRLEAKVAIKEYFPVDQVSRYADSTLTVITRAGRSQDSYSQGIRRFLKEARSLARMEKQTAVVAAKDFFEANNTAYIVMEYIQGTDLKTLVAQRGGRLSAQELFPMIEPLFAALDAVHQAGLIHRDISPDNVMLEKGKVRLLDFGCARESIKGTETMTVALKQGYAPVEQYQRKGQGPWTDVYALAAVIYFCLTGKVPPASLDRILEDELVPPRQLGACITAQQEAALMKALSISGRHRYQSIAAFYEALYHPVETPPQPAAEPEPEPEPSPKPRTSWSPAVIRRVAIVAAAAVLILAAILAGIGIGGNQQGPEPTDPPFSSQPGQDVPPDTGGAALSGDIQVSTGEELWTALESDSVSTITVAPDSHLSLAEHRAVTLNKPLYLSAGAQLDMSGLLTVGEGGHIQIDSGAHLYIDAGTLRAHRGGRVTVKSGGSMDLFRILVDQDEDLTMEEGAVIQLLSMTAQQKADLYADALYLIMPSDALFADSVRVTTEEELLQAVHSGAASITIAAGSQFRLTSPVRLESPLLIEEGAVLSIDTGASLEAADTLLLNHGTILAAAQPGQFTLSGSGEFKLYNYGRIDAGFGFLDEPAGYFLNLGVVDCHTAVVRHSQFDNLGTISFYGNKAFEFQSMTANFGTWSLNVDSTDHFFHVENFDNTGDIIIGANARLYNRGIFRNYAGSIRSSGNGACLYNEGILHSEAEHSSISLTHENSALLGSGLLSYHENGLHLVGGLTASENWLLYYDWYDNEYIWDAADSAAIARAFSGNKMAFLDCDLHLTGDWTITAPIVVWGSLTVDGNLTVKGGFLDCDALHADTLTLTDGAVAYVEAGLDIPGGIYLTDSAFYCDTGGQIQTALDLQRSTAALYGAPAVQNATVSLEESQLTLLSDCQWNNCDSITVSSNSRISLLAGFTLTDANLTNHGSIQTSMWHWNHSIVLNGIIDNYGTMDLSADAYITVGGTLRNFGQLYTLYVNAPDAGGLIVTGRLENYGTHYHHSIGAQDILVQGGSITGDPFIPWET